MKYFKSLIHRKLILNSQFSILNSCGGQSLVELLMAIALAAVLLPALLTGLVTSRSGKAQQDQRLLAFGYLKESQEATRSIRDAGWSGLAANGIYHPVASESGWAFVGGPETINGFTRQVVISDVARNGAGVVVSSGGTVDPSTKQVITSVSWGSPIASTISATMYFSRYLNNALFIDTAQADFNSGSKSGVIATNTSGGEVQLGAGGNADWCAPNLTITALDLPKNGVANAVSTVQGTAIAGTGENASGVSLANVSISNTNPPIATISGTIDGYKTNDVFTDGNYAYLATDNNGKEVVIIDLTTHSEVGYFNAPGSSDATSVYVLGNRGYVTAGSWLYVFDLTSKTGSRPQAGNGLFFLGSATSVVVNGDYAYVSLASSIIELQIIDISNPQSLSNTGWADVNGTDGKRVFVNQTATRAYLATGQDASRKEFFIINISGKTGSRPIVGSYEANGMNPANLAVVSGNKAILVGTGAEEYQVVDVTTESNPSRCGGMSVDTGVRGIAAVLETDGDAFSYIVTGDLNSEFKIIEGGPGGQFATSGNFESRTFYSTSSAAFNRFFATATIPSQTALTFQFAGVGVNQPTGNCNGVTYNYIGPDGTSYTYYATTSGQMPFSMGGYNNPAACFRYKAFLSTTDQTQSPVLYDMSVNYSP